MVYHIGVDDRTSVNSCVNRFSEILNYIAKPLFSRKISANSHILLVHSIISWAKKLSGLMKYVAWLNSYIWMHCAILTIKRRMQIEVSKGEKIRNRYNQIPHLTQDTNRKVTNYS